MFKNIIKYILTNVFKINTETTDKEIDDEKMVARALLPSEIMIGSHLKYEIMQYEMN